MSGGKSQSSGRQEQNVWGAQSPYLQDIYAQSGGALQQAQATNQQMMPGIEQSYQNMINPQGNPYLDQMAQSGLGQLQQNFGQTLSQIRGGAAAGGSLGGSRQGVAEGIASQDMGTQANNFLGNLYGGQYQADQNRALGGLGMAGQITNQAFAPLAGQASLIGGPTVLGSGSNESKTMRFGT